MYLTMRYSRNVTSFLGIFAVCGPVTVSQAGQRLFSGQAVPLGLFLPSTSPADRTCSPIPDRAADTAAGGETQTSLFIACRCLRRRQKTNTLTATLQACGFSITAKRKLWRFVATEPWSYGGEWSFVSARGTKDCKESTKSLSRNNVLLGWKNLYSLLEPFFMVFHFWIENTSQLKLFSVSLGIILGRDSEIILMKLEHATRLCLNHVCGHLTFGGDKLERVAEYSEPRDSLLWAVIYKLVAQTVPTLATQNLHAWNTITSVSDCRIGSSKTERAQKTHWWQIWDVKLYLEGG